MKRKEIVIRRNFISLLSLLLLCQVVKGEIKDIGTPYIRNFTKSDYQAGAQNWGVAQDGRGFMYFGNQEGLLVYDGVKWQLYSMPNRSMVRSIFIDSRGDIYVGAYNDLGRMTWSENGQMTFRSLKEFIPEEHRNFDDVWHIFAYKDKIVFESYYATYFYKEGSPVAVLTPPSRFQNSFSVRGRLIFNDDENGLMEYNGTRLEKIDGCSELTGQDIISMMPFGTNNEILICTAGRGLYIYDGAKLAKWNIPADRTLKRDQIYSTTMLHDSHFAIGTILNGVVIIDIEGNIVQHINKKKGLQNNTINNLYPDRAGNLWLSLDKGIDHITVNSPITFIQNSEGFGAGYSSVIHNERIYLGTNQGLYVKSWGPGVTEQDYTMIPGTDGQVWYLGVHKGVLLCGHNKGTFIVKGDRAEMISTVPGGWKYHELKRYPGYMIGGTFSGIILFRWSDGSWKYARPVEGFNESFRVFEEDDEGDLWMSHGFKGIFRVRLDSGMDTVSYQRFYNTEDGLPSDYNLVICRIKGKIIVASENGIYEYSPGDDRFVRSVYFSQLLSPLESISYLKEDTNGNIWYVAQNRTGIFRLQEDYTYRQFTSPFLLLSGKFIHGFESIYSWSPDHLFIGTEDGFAHYSSLFLKRGYPEFSAYITRVEGLHQDSVFLHGRGPSSAASASTPLRFEYRNNNIRFTYTSPVYDIAGKMEFSTILEGYDERWSVWSSSFTKEYSNLPDGKFTFQVRARNQIGAESLPDSLDLIVEHPWYKSMAAYIVYVVAGLSLIMLLVLFVNWRIELANRRERLNNQRVYDAKEQEYIRQALEAEKEIIRIRNEKLHAEMILRDKELANEAMNLVRKNEFLISLKDEMNNLKQNCSDVSTDTRIKEIISRISGEVDSNRQREVFESAFDEVHEDFLNRLKGKYPSLTPTELRLCAFLKMNIQTKEIAPLMNISVRGVEICRYRVRKKMKISRDTNLTRMLIDL